jgi:hypothetical protein
MMTLRTSRNGASLATSATLCTTWHAQPAFQRQQLQLLGCLMIFLFDVQRSIVVHWGAKASMGHYTSYVHNPTSGQWKEYNDDRVYEVHAHPLCADDVCRSHQVTDHVGAL